MHNIKEFAEQHSFCEMGIPSSFSGNLATEKSRSPLFSNPPQSFFSALAWLEGRA